MFIIVQTINISNKCCSFELPIHKIFLNNWFPQKSEASQLFSNIDTNQKCFLIIILEWFLKDYE